MILDYIKVSRTILKKTLVKNQENGSYSVKNIDQGKKLKRSMHIMQLRK